MLLSKQNKIKQSVHCNNSKAAEIWFPSDFQINCQAFSSPEPLCKTDHHTMRKCKLPEEATIESPNWTQPLHHSSSGMWVKKPPEDSKPPAIHAFQNKAQGLMDIVYPPCLSLPKSWPTESVTIIKWLLFYMINIWSGFSMQQELTKTHNITDILCFNKHFRNMFKGYNTAMWLYTTIYLKFYAQL